MTVASLCNDILVLAVFLLVGFFVRELCKPLQKLFLPSSLIGGLILLLLGQQILGVVEVPRELQLHSQRHDRHRNGRYRIRRDHQPRKNRLLSGLFLYDYDLLWNAAGPGRIPGLALTEGMARSSRWLGRHGRIFPSTAATELPLPPAQPLRSWASRETWP